MIRLLLFSLYSISILKVIQCQSLNCNVEKKSYPPTNRVELSYHCYPPTIDNPPFPTGGSRPSEYNEVHLSPNTYTTVPFSNLCEFTNIYLLDMSFNKLTSITNVFQTLRCLISLRTLKISSNLISTGIKNSDFDDTFSAQLEHIDLSSNQIPSIDSDVFIRTSNGASRFPNLKFLNLGNNRIKEFDLLWPLTIPSSLFNLNISANPINTLTNSFNGKYSDARFAYPATGSRVIDVTNNILEEFDDTNLLQYGITTQNEFLAFLNKIANYDFRQNSFKRVVCQCTGSTQNVITWYKALRTALLIDQSSLISQFSCINSTQSVFLELTTCQTNGTARTTTRSSATAAVGALVTGDTTDYTLYWLFFLLLIPLFILLLIIICCCLRPLNKCLYKCCNTTCCKVCRPGERRKAGVEPKKYDATIVYSEFDEGWVQTKLLPSIVKQGKAYKIHLLTSYHKGFAKMDRAQFENLKSSKRIILVFSKNFLKEEWKSEAFQNELKIIAANDPDCVIIPINIGDVTKEIMNENVDTLEEYYAYDTLCFTCIKRCQHSTTLKDVEPLHAGSTKFAANLRFLMPIKKVTGSASIITDSSNQKREYVLESPSSIKFESETDLFERSRNSFVNQDDDLPLMSTKRMPKSNKVAPFGTKQTKQPSYPKKKVVNAEQPRRLDDYNGSGHDISISSVVIPTKSQKSKVYAQSDNQSLTSDLIRTQMKQDDVSINLSFIQEGVEDSVIDIVTRDNRKLPTYVLPRDVLIGHKSRNIDVNDEDDRSNIEAHEKTIELQQRSRSHEKKRLPRFPMTRLSRSVASKHSEDLPRELYTNYKIESDNEIQVESGRRHKKHKKSKTKEIYDKLNPVPIIDNDRIRTSRIHYDPPKAYKTFMH